MTIGDLYLRNDAVLYRYIGCIIDYHTRQKDYDFEVLWVREPYQKDFNTAVIYLTVVGEKATLTRDFIESHLKPVPKDSPLYVLYGPKGGRDY